MGGNLTIFDKDYNIVKEGRSQVRQKFLQLKYMALLLLATEVALLQRCDRCCLMSILDGVCLVLTCIITL